MFVGIDYLREGMVVEDPVYLGNALFIPANRVLTKENIERLKSSKDKLKNSTIKIAISNNFNKSKEQLECEKNWNTNNIDLTIDQETKGKIKDELRKITRLENKNITSSIELVEKCAEVINNKIFSNNVKATATNSTLNYDLSDYIVNNDIYEHSIRVAEFSVVIANEYNKKKENEGNSKDMIDLNKIVMAALLHDYGVRFKDENEMRELSKKQLNDSLISRYNLDENLLKEPYKEKFSPVYSFMSLPLDSTISGIILYSGEDNIKSGPLKTTDETLKTSNSVKAAARIIRLCSLYDDILKSTITNNDSINLESIAIKLNFMAKSGIVDHEMKDIFVENIPLYSIGTRVQLSDGNFARVISRPRKEVSSATPTVITTDHRIIDLAMTPDVKIKKIVPNGIALSNLVNDIAKDQINGISSELTDFLAEKKTP